MRSSPSDPESQDRVFIRDLSVQAILGILEHERRQPQTVLVSAELFTNPRPADAPDAIDACIDYSQVAEQLADHVRNARRFTVEALVEELAQICLSFEGVNRVRVRVEKPQAIEAAASVGVEIERYRKDQPV